MSWVLAADVLDAYVRGCDVLGSGGGGDTRTAAALLRQLLTADPVTVLAPDDVADDAAVVTVGAIGSPTVMRERIPYGGEFSHAVRTLERYCATQFEVVAPLEIGGVNGVLAVVVAAVLGRPLLDCDGMGRAWPRLEQVVLHGRIPETPVALANPSGGVVLIDGVGSGSVSATIAAALPSLGGWAAMAAYPSSWRDYRDVVLTGSVSRALAIGQGVLGSSWTGTVCDVARFAGGGGVAVLAAEGNPASLLRVDLAEEYVTAMLDGDRLAAAPDVISLTDARSGAPIGVPDLRIGQRLSLVVLPSPEALGLDPARWGLASYGLADVGAKR